jgi:hypothetical protein
VLGVVFDSTAMGAADTPEVQAGVVKLTMMIGGPHYTSGTVAVPADARSLIPAALAHLRTTLPDLPKALEPLAVYAQTHRDCIPTYKPGHGSRMRDIHESLGHGDWQGRLAVTGAGWGGVRLGDCTENGASLAERLLNEDSVAITGLERWKAWECVLLRPFAIPSERKLTSPGLFLFQRLYCPGPADVDADRPATGPLVFNVCCSIDLRPQDPAPIPLVTLLSACSPGRSYLRHILALDSSSAGTLGRSSGCLCPWLHALCVLMPAHLFA